MFGGLKSKVLKSSLAVTTALVMASAAQAGNFAADWNTLAYPASVLAPAAPDFVLTDQYGFQLRMALTHPATSYTTAANPAEDTASLGGINDIFFGSDPAQGSGGFGEDSKSAVMNIYQTGTTTNVPVNGLSMVITDIDPSDTNTLTDRCDFVTVTGNAGNPTLSYPNGAPTGAGTNVSYLIGPSTGPGTSGTNANSRTIFTKTGGGTARTNLNFTANQAHCLYYTNTTSTASDNNTVGTMNATFPNGTSRATITYDEVIENALGATTPANQNAAGRGVGLWGAVGFSTNNTITLDKQTTATSFTAIGEVISYSYIVTNVGPLPMNSGQNIQINDTKIGLISCPAIPVAGIAVGATHTCTANYTVTAADVTAGQVSNTATAGVGTGAQAFASRLQSNSDIVVVPGRARLTLVKTVTNNNGGTATPTSVTLSATGPTTISGLSGAPVVTNALVAPGTYALAETALAGYTPSPWSCTTGTLTGSNLSLSVGQNATCTINNNDIGPVLTLVKTVTDTSGGPSTVPLFTLTATGPVTVSGITGAAAVTNATINAGTYALSETNVAGYTAGAWACSAGSLVGSNLTLTLGQTTTCTINNIKRPTLVVRKISNGGTGTFGFSGPNGVLTENIATTTVGSTFTGGTATLLAHDTVTTITETMPAAFWQIETATCTGMGTGGTASLAGNILTLNAAATAAGRNIVCTFTNRRLPTVMVQKITTGGSGGPFNFGDINLTGTVADISTTAPATATPASPARLLATSIGIDVSLTETASAAWVPSGVTCNDNNNVVSLNTNPVASSTSGAVTIPGGAVRVGADISCVFTNAAAAPSMTIDKIANSTDPVNAGNTIGYTYRVTNTGNVPINNVTINDVHGGFGTDPVPGNEVLFNDVAPLGNSTDAGVNASWNVLAPGDTISFTSNYSVVQADIDNLQ